jgi:hypothetical protein
MKQRWQKNWSKANVFPYSYFLLQKGKDCAVYTSPPLMVMHHSIYVLSGLGDQCVPKLKKDKLQL